MQVQNRRGWSERTTHSDWSEPGVIQASWDVGRWGLEEFAKREKGHLQEILNFQECCMESQAR